MFSLIIQGPIHHNTIINVELNSHLFDDIIISTYRPETPNEIHLLNLLPKSCNIVYNLRKKTQLYNPTNLINQLNSTLKGLKTAKQPITIKIRSDEYYNLELLRLDKLVPSKIYSSNFIVRDFYTNNFGFSDHFIICNTNVFLNSLMLLKLNLKCYSSFYESCRFSPETLIYSSFISYLSHSKELIIKLKKKESLNYTKKFIELIDVSNLSPYCLIANNYGIKSSDLKNLTGLFQKNNIGYFNYFRKVDDLYPSYPIASIKFFIWRVVRRVIRFFNWV